MNAMRESEHGKRSELEAQSGAALPAGAMILSKTPYHRCNRIRFNGE